MQRSSKMTYQDEIRAISTPDRASTSIGDLDFFDGVPTTATAERAYDYIDRASGVEVFLNAMPGASVSALMDGPRARVRTIEPGPDHGQADELRVAVSHREHLVVFRVYGPEQPWIDKTWRPGEVELVRP